MKQVLHSSRLKFPPSLLDHCTDNNTDLTRAPSPTEKADRWRTSVQCDPNTSRETRSHWPILRVLP